MKKILILLFLVPFLVQAQRRVDIKLPTFDPAPYKKAYYTIGQSPDSSYVTIKSIDGLQIDTIKFAGGTGVLGATKLPKQILHFVDSATTGWSPDTLNVINYMVPNDGVLHHYELKIFRASGSCNRYTCYSVGPYGIPILGGNIYNYQNVQDLTYQFVCSPNTPLKLIGPIGTSTDFRSLLTLIEIAQYPLPTY